MELLNKDGVEGVQVFSEVSHSLRHLSLVHFTVLQHLRVLLLLQVARILLRTAWLYFYHFLFRPTCFTIVLLSLIGVVLCDRSRLSLVIEVVSLEAQLSYILCNLRLVAIDCNQMLREAQVQGSLIELGLLHEVFQVDLVRLDEPQVLRLVRHFLVSKGH